MENNRPVPSLLLLALAALFFAACEPCPLPGHDAGGKPCSHAGDPCCLVAPGVTTCQGLGPNNVPLVCDPAALTCVECGTAGQTCCPAIDGSGYYCRDGSRCDDSLLCL